VVGGRWGPALGPSPPTTYHMPHTVFPTYQLPHAVFRHSLRVFHAFFMANCVSYFGTILGKACSRNLRRVRPLRAVGLFKLIAAVMQDQVSRAQGNLRRFFVMSGN